MGISIHAEEFAAELFQRFDVRLHEQLRALKELLARPGFGVGPRTIGAELEMFLIDGDGLPLRINGEVMSTTRDKRITLEMAQFNIESNARPLALGGQTLTELRDELQETVTEVARAAAAHGGMVALVGMLPTLKGMDMLKDATSDAPRYRALSRGLARLRGGRPLRIRIQGEESLEAEWNDVTIQGANTSFQLHLRVNPADFARAYNAAQLATAPALAGCVNSPILMGWKLWDETRVALFEQALDDRADTERYRPARASFGSGWCREGAWELFAEAIDLHSPLLPVCGEEDAFSEVRAGRVPHLDDLKLHNGTVWRWNRPVYDSSGGGHVRIEFRPLPSGPTVTDMVAGAAFLLGLTLGLVPDIDELLPAMPFSAAAGNFYAAAKSGLDAQLLWPTRTGLSPRIVQARELIVELLPRAKEGLLSAGIAQDEVEHWLGCFGERVERGMTGARWQKLSLLRWEQRLSRSEALAAMFAEYREYASSERPVHEWPTSPLPRLFDLAPAATQG
ncbi:MAG: glutamate--cysteine ligase [Myxococcaceae bacterium]